MLCYIYTSFTEEPRVVVATSDHISFNNLQLSDIFTSLPVTGTRALAGIDIYVKKEMLFFSDSKTMKVYSMNINGDNLTEVCTKKVLHRSLARNTCINMTHLVYIILVIFRSRTKQ